MREIKFRAWNKKNKKMYWVCHVDTWFKRIAISSSTVDKYDYIDFNDIELMQYTGLKDKNGKEIYEDDFVKVEDYDYWFYVYYYPDNAKFNLIGYPIEDNMEVLNFADIPEEDIKIIGNSFENPELKRQYEKN